MSNELADMHEQSARNFRQQRENIKQQAKEQMDALEAKANEREQLARKLREQSNVQQYTT